MLRVYAVNDVVAHDYKNVFLANTDGEAVRGVLPQLSFFCLNINSAQLFYVGDFDDKTGVITPSDHVLVSWNCFDYEHHMPDAPLQALKNNGTIPSPEKFVNAQVVGDALKAIGLKLGLDKN